jgi:hypothetical protein
MLLSPDEILKLPFDKPIQLDNITCVYCGTVLSDANFTKEHVVGRRFVPVGSLNKKWNLIVRACRSCNNKKADLEDEISAISMQPDAYGNYPSNEPHYISEAKRKARGSRSRSTGKRVGDSALSYSFPQHSYSGHWDYEVVCPPQVEPNRIMELARLHIVAFFYHATFKKNTRTGHFWRGNFVMLPEAKRCNWGDLKHIAFMQTVVSWEPRFLAYDHNENFNIVLRKHPNADCWAWALEWNQNFRVIGFCGDAEASNKIYADFPQYEFQQSRLTNGEVIATKPDRILQVSDDLLFVWRDEN